MLQRGLKDTCVMIGPGGNWISLTWLRTSDIKLNFITD